jgi:hypothetical protein
MGLMSREGWIPREQILGNEVLEKHITCLYLKLFFHQAISKVPPEFQLQVWNYANPPTFLFLVEKEIEQTDEVHSFSEDSATPMGTAQEEKKTIDAKWLFPYLERWYHWLETTQKGADGHFRWVGQVGNHTLTVMCYKSRAFFLSEEKLN